MSGHTSDQGTASVRLRRAGARVDQWRLFRHFLARDLKNRFLGSFTGGLWALIQPLVQLAIYAFVFVHIFKARLPGADAPDYVPFLIVALWPWTAFSEGVLRATTAIVDNAGLIGKVALPRQIPVLATVTASFLLHGAGFIAIVLILPLFGYATHPGWLPAALLAMILLWVLATGFALLFSAIQVFVRDLMQVLTQLLMLAMFAAPIFYAREMMPERFQSLMDLHPYTWYAEAMRDMLLRGQWPAPGPTLVAIVVAIVIAGAGAWVFHRLDRQMEDFL